MAGKGSSPGERRGGRKKGVPNKITSDIRAFAQGYGQDAIEAAAAMAGLIAKEGFPKAESEQVRHAALHTILDRAYGKPSQTLNGTLDVNLTHEQALDELITSAGRLLTSRVNGHA